MSGNKVIPIGMITDDNFIMPTSVAITSIIFNKNDDTHIIFFIIMAECSDESKKKIIELGNLSNECEVHLIERDLEKYRNFKQLQHVPISCLLKFELCDLLPSYEKILYLDGDIIVRGDLWELYNLDLSGKYAVGVRDLNSLDGQGNINAGILLYNARRIRDEKLGEKMFEVRKQLGDRASMDQQTFNIVTKREYIYTSIKYNCVIGKLANPQNRNIYPIEKINRIYDVKYNSIEELINEAVIIHYATSNKPWIYTFIPEAKEWYKYYMLSPYNETPFELKGIWKYRWDNMVHKVSERGLAGLIDVICNKLCRLSNINKKDEPWE